LRPAGEHESRERGLQLAFAHGGTLARVAVPDDAFETMLARARGFRKRVAELGLSAPMIEADVEARLHWLATGPALPSGQAKLADEILALLRNPGLSPQQAQRLESAFRGM
jgi:hypothetical protein